MAQVYARLSLDEFDNAYFPRSGNKGTAEYSWAREDFGSDSDFDQLRLRFAQAFSWGRNTLVAAARYDTTLEGTAPIESQFRAGGFLQLSGYQPRELNGQHFGGVALVYYRLLADIKLAPTYGGFSLEYGNVWQNRGDIVARQRPLRRQRVPRRVEPDRAALRRRGLRRARPALGLSVPWAGLLKAALWDQGPIAE